MPRLSVALTAAPLLGLAALAVACGGGSAKPTRTPTADISPTPPGGATSMPAATEPEPTAAPTFTGSREPVEVPGPAAPPVLVLTDVRAAAHEGYDRIVFEFQDALPGYRVEYLTNPTQCGSGEAVPLSGQQAALQVRFSPAAAHNDQGTPTFGTTALGQPAGNILEAVRSCDFEAVLTWAVILSQQLDFRVTALANPPRLVIDVAHP